MDSDRRLVLPFELLHFIILNYFDAKAIVVNSNIVISEINISILAHVNQISIWPGKIDEKKMLPGTKL